MAQSATNPRMLHIDMALVMGYRSWNVSDNDNFSLECCETSTIGALLHYHNECFESLCGRLLRQNLSNTWRHKIVLKCLATQQYNPVCLLYAFPGHISYLFYLVYKPEPTISHT